MIAVGPLQELDLSQFRQGAPDFFRPSAVLQHRRVSTTLRQVLTEFSEFFSFPPRNFSPGSPSNDDRRLGRPTASPLFLSSSGFAFPKWIAAVSSAFAYRRRFRSGNRFVDPDLAGKSRWFGNASYEALRVTLVSNIEHILALP
jgi:hypothetical protein